ncbi:pachytene checkpoint protein 2 [Gorgonomyces haynaldii]|nr:pachytene checkpoint protein 2 [Gorgonomyces haynaldii]
MPFIRDNIQMIYVAEASDTDESLVRLKDVDLLVHCFKFQDQSEREDHFQALSLPCKELYELWDTLVIPQKYHLLEFIHSCLLFSDAGVNDQIVHCNRIVLLHGPPGTGKTSLLKALAETLSIRLNDRFHQFQLIEIKASSLFSKFFAESSKQVEKLFGQISQWLEDKTRLVFVLMDEIESLVCARQTSIASNEPSDAIRVVNTILTNLDRLRHNENVLIMATSNLEKAIDDAFLDRADITAYIGHPEPLAIYHILKSCLDELGRCGIIQPFAMKDYRQQALFHTCPLSMRLWKIAQHLQGKSGRFLRKLVFLVHCQYIRHPTTTCGRFLQAMAKFIH